MKYRKTHSDSTGTVHIVGVVHVVYRNCFQMGAETVCSYWQINNKHDKMRCIQNWKRGYRQFNMYWNGGNE